MTDEDQSNVVPSTTQRRRWLKSVRSRVIAAVVAVLALVGTAVITPVGAQAARLLCNKVAIFCVPAVAVAIDSNPDEVAPQKAWKQNYLTSLDPARVPGPPVASADCAGRYRWVHDLLHGTDALQSFAQVDITATRGNATVDGFNLHLDSTAPAPATSTVLSCPGGRGDTDRGHNAVTIDLDQSSVALTTASGNASTSVDIAEGQTSTFDVSASTIACACRWRVEARLLIGGEVKTITIGPLDWREGTAAENPDQAPFETTASTSGTVYFYLDGKWMAQEPSAQPAPPQLCNLLPDQAVDGAFGRPMMPQPGGVASADTPQTTPGASGAQLHQDICVWQSIASEKGAYDNLNLQLDTLDTPEHASAEADAFARLLIAETHPADPTVRPLPSAGDRAFSVADWVVVLRGKRLLLMSGIKADGRAIDPVITERLARITLTHDW